ncbi:hypothetical protein B296_00046347 [Ensete ventricosum]|uniref:C2 domain-containing protein n=1 Tax=Ensete ventricosum TaxID=4639 RepID=A0A426Z466_ENSVE|nr:hypothetical protein B296_00046347 [Ensete ventricosum]
MGDAELDIQPFMDAVKMDLAGIPNVTRITTVRPSRQNCLADDSHISRKDGTVAQDVVLRLRNVESGEVELQLLWVNTPRFFGSLLPLRPAITVAVASRGDRNTAERHPQQRLSILDVSNID